MSTFSQLPGTLDIRVIRGDSVTVDVDFDTDLTGHTATASLVSVVTGGVVRGFTTTIENAASGLVSVSLTDEETSAVTVGSYSWEMTWQLPTGGVRKALTGYVEVKSR